MHLSQPICTEPMKHTLPVKRSSICTHLVGQHRTVDLARQQHHHHLWLPKSSNIVFAVVFPLYPINNHKHHPTHYPPSPSLNRITQSSCWVWHKYIDIHLLYLYRIKGRTRDEADERIRRLKTRLNTDFMLEHIIICDAVRDDGKIVVYRVANHVAERVTIAVCKNRLMRGVDFVPSSLPRIKKTTTFIWVRSFLQIHCSQCVRNWIGELINI